MTDISQAAPRCRPILFSGPMVAAILAGRKTQTRRVLRTPRDKYEPVNDWVRAIHQDGGGNWIAWSDDAPGLAEYTKRRYPTAEGFPCPYGRPGDRLWVRETWGDYDGRLFYRADGDLPEARWRPSIYMPRRAARLLLELTDVRPERLQAISAADVAQEGLWDIPPDDAQLHFARLWDSINGRRARCAWADNPWVWRVSFRRVSE